MGLLNQVPSPQPQATPSVPSAGVANDPVGKALPANLQDAYLRFVTAGKALMYSPQMRDQVKEELNQNIPMFQKLGEAVAGLVLILDQQGKNVPTDILIPATVTLIKDAVDFLKQMGINVSQDDETKAIQYGAMILMKKMGLDNNTITQMFTGQHPATAGAMPQQGAQ